MQKLIDITDFVLVINHLKNTVMEKGKILKTMMIIFGIVFGAIAIMALVGVFHGHYYHLFTFINAFIVSMVCLNKRNREV